MRRFGQRPGRRELPRLRKRVATGDRNAPVFFSPDGLVIEVHGDERYADTYAAAAIDGSRTFTRSDVQALSPFVLLDAATPGLDSDVDVLVATVKGASPSWKSTPHWESGIPTEASLLSALDHANHPFGLGRRAYPVS